MQNGFTKGRSATRTLDKAIKNFFEDINNNEYSFRIFVDLSLTIVRMVFVYGIALKLDQSYLSGRQLRAYLLN